ncbi:DNA primase [Castellaniella denitrificans]|uniref:DNA primase n=1 Tax=Castellaniella denitrificans TaxID=56119 RepID=A0ABT4M542_9BURK|nr:DNA primase [Castellaniella denitrificans]MCZ4330421.1 DNA primase [Castellaniella denitrificans]
MIPDSFIQELLARVDIVDVVGRYVKLRKGGANLLGLCPFHNEKTPSFTVSPTKQFYHCFGCGAHGTALRFLTEHTGAPFPEAVRGLAASVGMTVPEEPRSPRQRAADRERREEGSRQQRILDQAQAHYRAALKQAPEAIEYLKRRGLSGEIAARFGLGWASRDRRGLAAVFTHYEDPALLESGLVIESEDGRRHDRFRGRVMFPIHNPRGQLIGFGGRLIEPGEPKYLNSPETSLFSKGNELYGLHEARAGVRAEGCVLVVEGYMDVVALAQYGLNNAVATLGTSTTPEHLRKLRRASDRIVFSFDGDGAGRKAAWRALQACLPWVAEDISMRFLFLPEGHDPDSYVRAYGVQALRAYLDEAMPLSRFMLDELASRHDLEEAEGRAACVHEARPLFAQMPEGGFRLQLEREFARRVRLTPEELAQLLAVAGPAAGGPGQHAATGRPAGQGGVAGSMGASARLFRPEEGHGPESGEPPWQDGEYPDAAPDLEGAPPWAGDAPTRAPRGSGRMPRRGGGSRQVTPMARRLLRLLLAHPALVSGLGDQQLELLAHHPHLELVRQLIGLASTCGAAHAGALLQAADSESDLARAIQDLSTELMAQDLPDPQAEWDDALRLIERQTVQEQCDRLIESGLTTDEDRRRYQDLSRRLARLKAGAG